MEEDIRARLAGTLTIAAQVRERITWGAREQGAALPAVCMQVISGPREYQMSGPTGLKAARVQVECWGSTYEDAKRLARLVNTSLGGAIFGVVQGAFLDSERDIAGTDAGGRRVFCTSMDFRVWAGE